MTERQTLMREYILAIINRAEVDNYTALVNVAITLTDATLGEKS